VFCHLFDHPRDLDMLHWLRKHYANTNILALNPPETQQLGDL
jgi:hypothetical protein